MLSRRMGFDIKEEDISMYQGNNYWFFNNERTKLAINSFLERSN